MPIDQTNITNLSKIVANRPRAALYSLRALLLDVDLPIIVCHGNRKIIWANARARTALGMTDPSAFSRPLDSFFSSDDRDHIIDRLVLAAGGVSGAIDVRINDATSSWAELRLVPLGGLGSRRKIALTVHSLTSRVVAQTERENRRLQESKAQLRDDIEVDRRRIAHALHDETGQDLMAVQVQLGRLKQRFEGERELSFILEAMQRSLQSATASMRRTINDLRPLALDDLGFVAAARELIKQIEQSSGVAVDLEIEGDSKVLTPAEQTNLYRTLQECLANVVRHAQATEMTVKLSCINRRAELVVHDNGKGFELVKGSSRGSYGLLGMRERAELLGGAFTVETDVGSGCKVQFSFPMLGNEVGQTL